MCDLRRTGGVSGGTRGDSTVGISLKMARAFSQHRAICGVRFLVSTSSPITFRRTVVTSTMKNTALTHASALRLVGMGDDTTEIRHHRASSSNGPDARVSTYSVNDHIWCWEQRP